MIHRLAAFATSAFVLALAAPVGAAPPLDHFQIYSVKSVPAPFEVGLLDQFGPAFKPGKLQAITFFANPTRKVAGNTTVGISDANAHLTWYTLLQAQPEPVRTVRFKNQFGQHSVDIKDPRALLVPTQKTSHAGSEFPRSLDHYKCYRVVKVNTAPPPPKVTLGDQFGTRQNVQVGPPALFCTPAWKERKGEKPTALFDEKDHLAIYKLPAAPKPLGIKTKDQFGEHQLNVLSSVMLAVPTEKQVAVPH